MVQEPTVPFSVDDLLLHDFGPWPEGLSLRREDMYGDDGRCPSSIRTSWSIRPASRRKSALRRVKLCASMLQPAG